MEKAEFMVEGSDRGQSVPPQQDAASSSTELKGGGTEMVVEKQVKLPESAPVEHSGPVFDAKIGAFRTAVFLHEKEGRDMPSVVLEKSFTRDGESWEHQKMTLLNSKEIDKLICVLQDTKRALYDEFE